MALSKEIDVECMNWVWKRKKNFFLSWPIIMCTVVDGCVQAIFGCCLCYRCCLFRSVYLCFIFFCYQPSGCTNTIKQCLYFDLCVFNKFRTISTWLLFVYGSVRPPMSYVLIDCTINNNILCNDALDVTMVRSDVATGTERSREKIIAHEWMSESPKSTTTFS